MSRTLLSFAVLSLLAGSAAAADDAPKAGVRTTVPMPKPAQCNSPVSVAALGEAYYTEPSDDFLKQLLDVLDKCRLLQKGGGYAVVLFPATPTKGSANPSVIHVLLHAGNKQIEEVRSFPGITSATWIYLTDVEDDLPRIQLLSTPNENPLIGQLASLASTILTSLPITAKGVPTAAVIYVSAAHAVSLPFKRSTITESYFIERPGVDDKGKPKFDEIGGTATMVNIPRSWVTLHAGVGLLTGALRGAVPAKVADGSFVSDPISRTATLAGAAFHAPFDSSALVASPKERVGLVVAAVLTPASGIYVGPSFGWRGFAITAGGAWMWVHTPAEGFAVGDAVRKPEDGGPKEQLVYGRVRAWLIGATYVFK